MAETDQIIGKYTRVQIETASPAERVLIVYDVGITSCAKARAALAERKLRQASAHIIKAQQAVITLRESLDMDVQEISPALSRVYSTLRRKLLTASRRKSEEQIKDVERILSSFRDTWVQVFTAEGKAPGAASSQEGAGSASDRRSVRVTA